MPFKEFVKNPIFRKIILNPLQDAKKAFEDKIRHLTEATNDVADRLILSPRREIVELLISKLSQPQIDLTENEQWVLVRLFLEAKLCSPELMISELEQSMKKLELMFKAITLTLYRYYSVHQWYPDAIIRREVCFMGREADFYDRNPFGFGFGFNVKYFKKSECERIIQSALHSAKKFCVEKYDMFCKQFTTFKFDKLMTDFERIRSIFSKIFGDKSYLYGRTFDRELIDLRILNELFLPLNQIESILLDEKQKLDDFLSESYALLDEIMRMIISISNYHHEYRVFEAAESGDSKEPKYQELFDEMKGLVDLLTACLKKKCQDSCDCRRNFYGTGRMKLHPNKIIHKSVEITEDEMKAVDKHVKRFSDKVLGDA